MFLPLGITRDEALLAINDEVSKIAQTSEGMGLRVHRTFAEDVNESQLFITNASTQVKIEINTVFRGTVLAPKLRSLNPLPSEIFAIDVPAMLLDPAEIYAGKMLAVFAVYLCSHNRPPHEILSNHKKNIDGLYRNSLIGMIRTEAPTIDELVEVREMLRRDIITGFSEASRSFIKGFFSGTPNWDLLPFDHLSELPALQWKLHNLALFKVARPEELARQNRELESLLTSHPKGIS